MKQILIFVLAWLALMSSVQAQTVEYIHTNALGTPVAVTNASGVVIERSEYEPYGKLLNRPLTDGPGFTGHVQDAATGLTYMQQRYYDPGIGKMLSVDPVTAYSSKDMRHFNVYAYAFNNPYKFTDPDGRHPTCNERKCTGTIESIADAVYVWNTYLNSVIQNIILPIAQQSEQPAEPETSPSPPAPGNLVGTENSLGGPQGKRVNNGPLAPANGGTGDGETDFENLTGGQSGPAPEGMRLPEGSKVGENGVIFRPGSESKGARIDIPASGDKPHETLHYPPPPPPKDPIP